MGNEIQREACSSAVQCPYYCTVPCNYSTHYTHCGHSTNGRALPREQDEACENVGGRPFGGLANAEESVKALDSR